VHVIWQLL